MKNMILGLLVLLAVVSTTGVAAEVTKATQVKLYKTPHLNADILAKIKPDKRLVLIIQKGKWIKVGDPTDGTVGWINEKQYDRAVQNFYRPNVQTIFIRSDRDSSGQSKVDVVVYRNGEKLSGTEATTYYEQVKAQQGKDLKAMQAANRTMEQLMIRQMKQMQAMEQQVQALFNKMNKEQTVVQQEKVATQVEPAAVTAQ
jgi:hypothetical protein